MIQIDLPMPEACDECPLNYDFCWCKGFKDNEFDKWSDDWNDHVCDRETRPEYCPLKEQEAFVRCKDCIYRGDKSKCMVAVIADANGIEPFMLDNRGEWFCADGEAKE